MNDVIIIGKGPAGISAALYTARAGLSTLVIGKGEGSLGKAEKIENYYGLPEPISGSELVSIGLKQAENLGIEIINDEVIGIEYDGAFKVKISSKEFFARTVLLSTGAARKSPKIEGLAEFEGRGVSYCAICDAFFYRGRDIAVLGSGAYSANEAGELLPIVKSVTILTNGEAITTDMPSEATINTKKITKLTGDDILQEIIFDDGSSIGVNGLFIAIGVAGSSDFARNMGAETQNGKIIVDQKQATNMPGLFAAGDCTGGVMQISKAVGDGAKAGLEIINYVRHNKATN